MKSIGSMLMLLVMLVSLSHPAPVQAQPPADQPLVIGMSGDLWLWHPDSGSLEQITTWGYNQRPVLSPDGRIVAYNSVASQAVEAMRNNSYFFAGSPISNIWVIDLVTDEAVRIAEQPASLTQLDQGIIRSNPVWSPGGDRLAWLEFHPDGDFTYQLVVYDWVRRSGQIVNRDVPIGFADGGLVVPDVQWGAAGIAHTYGSYIDDGNDFAQFVNVYQPDGRLQLEALVNRFALDGANFDVIYSVLWVAQPDRDQLALVYQSGRIALLDAWTGLISEATAASAIDMLNPALPAERSVMTGFKVGQNAERQTQITWYAFPQGGGSVEGLAFNGQPAQGQITIAPDGSRLAYVGADGVYLWQAGQAQRIPGTASISDPGDAYYPTQPGVAWGSAIWQLAGTAAAPQTCALTTRLQIGAQARVLPADLPNAIRSEPRTGADNPTLGSIPVGGILRVMAGPVCADRFWWWLIEYDGITGWTPEGEGSHTYWLEPIN